jgi:hypothetical protein
MATYQININERTQLGKSIVALLKSATDTVSFTVPAKQETPPKSVMYKRLESGFKDVREILDGKQPKRTLKELLDEL